MVNSSRPAKGNGRCADLNLLARPNGFSPFRLSSRILFELDDTC
jgi:hypothetical protein